MLVAIIFALQFLTGFGIISRFDVIPKLPQKVALSILAGFFISSVSVFAAELLHIRLTVASVVGAVALPAIATNFRPRTSLARLRDAFKNYEYTIRIYEFPFLLAIGYVLFFSFWRTYAIPVTPYDSVVGIDLVARRAVQEGHIVSSIFFRPDFRPFLSTQPYYAPFTMLMQIIYRSAGLPFGQLWLGLLTVSYFVFAYHWLCEKLHPVAAGFLVLLLATSPEQYAYTFLLQTDFCNAVFFSIGVLFVIEFWTSKKKAHGMLAILFLAAACWSRTETILLIIPVSLILTARMYHEGFRKAIGWGGALFAGCACFTLLWNGVFFKFYFPVVPTVSEQIKWAGAYSAERSGKILHDMNSYFFSTEYWGYFLYAFLALWVIHLAVTRRREPLWHMALVVGFYLAFFVMLHHFALMNIEYTFRRAIMKFLLLMCLLMGHYSLKVP